MALTKPRAYQIYDIDYKQATRVITVANVTLSGGAPSQVDGVNLSLNDRVLVIGQTNKAQNGIYDVDTVGSGSNGTWVRSGDTNTTGELLAGTIVMVTEGVIYADTQWKLTTNDPITIGVSELVFEQNSAFAFGNVNANGTAVLANSVGSTISLSAGNNISITGNNTSKTVTIGVTGISLNSISNGTSNVNVVSSGGNVTVGIAGTSNVAVFGSTGANITGTLGVSGNITGGNLSGTLVTGTLTTAAQPNVTSVGTLSSLTVTANVAGGNLTTVGQVVASGNVTGGNILTAGLISATGNITGGNLNTASQVVATGNITGGNVLGGVLYATTTTANAVTARLTTGADNNYRITAQNGVASNSTGTEVSRLGLNYIGTGWDSFTQYIRGSTAQNGAQVLWASNTAIANVNSTGVAVTGIVSATGNVSGGNITTAGQLSTTGNATVGNLTTTIANFTTFNSSIGGNVTGTLVATSANAQFFNQTNGAGYVTVAGYLTVAGNVTGGNLISNALVSGITITASGNLVGGNANITNAVNAATISTSGNATIGGNLIVQGNITYINIDDLQIEDPVIILGTGPNGAPLTVNDNKDRGIFMEYYTTSIGNAFVGWDNSTGNMIVASDAGLTNDVVTVETYGTLQAGNLYVQSVLSTGNITGGNILGNGAGLTGINAFSNVTVTGGNSAVADSIADTLTLTAGSGITLVMDSATDTLTIAASSGNDIFVDGADFGTVTETVTASDDLGSVTDAVTAESDLGTIVTAGLIYPDQFVLPSFTTTTLPSAGIAGAMIYVTNESGGAVPAFADGTNWRRVTDRAIVS